MVAVYSYLSGNVAPIVVWVKEASHNYHSAHLSARQQRSWGVFM